MDSQERSPQPQAERRPYEKPEFHIYGNLAQITTMLGMEGVSDGGTGNAKGSRP
jgi:hypothetical protein